MAASLCRQLIAQFSPDLDVELSDYVIGVLEVEGEDFENGEDIYEAVGDMLLQGCINSEEDEIVAICNKMYSLLHKEQKGRKSSKPIRILDAPIHLGSLAEKFAEFGGEEEANNIWLAKKDLSMTAVNQRKLEKAEAKIKQKQEKRLQDPPKTENNYVPQSATVSQQTNRKDAKFEDSGQNKSYDIRVENFDVAFGNRVLIQCGDLFMSQGRRYGLVGRNGIGKTTLLRMLASGQIRIPSHISILHVEQEVVGDDTLATQSVLECDTKREALLKEEKDISAKLNSTSPSSDNSLSSRLSKVYQELESIESDKAPAKAAIILSGLGFSPRMQKMTTKEFSGGWRMRLALARALFTKPDLLLLDEPTNMLDMKAIIWLENYLQLWPTTLLVVSHDREFLNIVSTDVIYLCNRKLEAFKGNYENFVKAREEKLRNQQREYEAQVQYRAHVQQFIDKFRFNAKRASLVQSKIKLIEKLPELVPVEKESEVVMRLPECERLAPPILQLDEIAFSYSKDRVIFTKVDLTAAADSRICIVGENGTGKTTLLKILTGDLEPTSGLRHSHRGLRLGYFSQHHVDQLDMNQCSVEVIQSLIPGRQIEEYRNKLGQFGVSGELAMRPVSSLSGGQKSRVAFARMTIKSPNFLILDEPTNHLDMETIEALGKALKKFEGGVILVSHDERLLRMICSELWVCANGTVRSLEGGIDAYKKLVQDELAAQS